jgi:hypothetical protein
MWDAVVAELPAPAPHIARHVSHVTPLLLPGRLTQRSSLRRYWRPFYSIILSGELVERANVLIAPATRPAPLRTPAPRRIAVNTAKLLEPLRKPQN